MTIAQLLPLEVAALTLTACADGPKVRIDDNVRQSIKTVAINSTVDIPNTMHFNGTTQTVSANFGLDKLIARPARLEETMTSAATRAAEKVMANWQTTAAHVLVWKGPGFGRPLARLKTS